MDGVIGQLIEYLMTTEQASRHYLIIPSPPLLYTTPWMYKKPKNITTPVICTNEKMTIPTMLASLTPPSEDKVLLLRATRAQEKLDADTSILLNTNIVFVDEEVNMISKTLAFKQYILHNSYYSNYVLSQYNHICMYSFIQFYYGCYVITCVVFSWPGHIFQVRNI